MNTESYVVKIPIYDRNDELCAFDVVYVEEEQGDADLAAAAAIEALLSQFSEKDLLDDKTVFLDFTKKLLVRKLPEMFNPKKLVIQINQETLLNSEIMDMVKEYRNLGYSVALKSFEFNPWSISALENVDMLKINFAYLDDEAKNVIDIAKRLGKKIVIHNINDEESKNSAKELDVDYVEGSYLGTQIPKSTEIVRPHHGNFFRLMIEVTSEEPNFEEIERLVSMDVTLTYTLLKLVNSAYFAIRNRVESVSQALVILGTAQLRQWIYILSFKTSNGDLPSEFIKVSFLRANFCAELMQYTRVVPLTKSDAYLMGMFSTIEALMGVPLEEALSELNLSHHIINALTRQEGSAGLLYKLVLNYEKGDWVAMADDAEKLGIPNDMVAKQYIICMNEADKIWRGLMEVIR